MVGALGHKVVVPARRGCHGTREVGPDEVKPLRDLGLVQLVENWLFGALLILRVSHAVSESVNLTPISGMFRVACIVCLFGCPRRWCQMFVPLDHHGSCRHYCRCGEVTVASPGVAVDAAKDVVHVKAEVVPMAPPFIRRALRVEAIVRSAGRPGAAIVVTMNSLSVVR